MITRCNAFRTVTLCLLASFLVCGCSWFGKKKTAAADTTGVPLVDDTILPEEVGVSLPPRVEGGVAVAPAGAKFENVLFAFDSFQVQKNEVPKLEKVAEYLKKNPSLRLVTEGHCDERGSRDYNLSLGEHRADAVRSWLIGLGIENTRIQTRSYGEERPANPGHDESAWQMNRRVEFVLYQ